MSPAAGLRSHEFVVSSRRQHRDINHGGNSWRGRRCDEMRWPPDHCRVTGDEKTFDGRLSAKDFGIVSVFYSEVSSDGGG
jgi:hypothetical protein